MIKITKSCKRITCKLIHRTTDMFTVTGFDTETKMKFSVTDSSSALATELVYRELVLINKLVKG